MNGDEDSVLTVEEAARKLRIGRGAAYAQARRWRETNGREGLPVIKLGRTLRVPRAAFDRHLLKLVDPATSEVAGSDGNAAPHPQTASGHEAKRSRTGTGE